MAFRMGTPSRMVISTAPFDSDLIGHGMQFFHGIRDHVAHLHPPIVAHRRAVHIIDINGHYIFPRVFMPRPRRSSAFMASVKSQLSNSSIVIFKDFAASSR